MKTKYQATLKSGEVVNRKSDRIYSHHWRNTFTKEGRKSMMGGWSGSYELAIKASTPHSSFINNNWEIETEIVEAKIV